MPTPEQQKEYTRLSGVLQAIGMRHYAELPKGTTSLLLTATDGKVSVEAYDTLGKPIGVVPHEMTSSILRSDLQRAFGGMTLPDDSIIAIVSNPVTVRPR